MAADFFLNGTKQDYLFVWGKKELTNVVLVQIRARVKHSQRAA